MPTFQDPRRWASYTGSISGGGQYNPRNPAFPPTASAPPAYPGLHPAITGLLTPGLVPDIARQSAEVAAGRGVAGSPAAGSTAVRMSEQNYLQRLALAHTLMGGEAQNLLPYQITPYQSAELQSQRDIAGAHYGGGGGQSYAGGGGGARPAPAAAAAPWAGFSEDFHGTRPFEYSKPPWTTGAGEGVPGAGQQPTLDDAFDWLGFGNFGSQPGDVSGSTEGDWLGS